MKSRCEFTKGGPHALSICLILAAVGLAVFSPAPGQVFGDLAVSEVDSLPANGAPPSPIGLENPAKDIFGLFSLPKMKITNVADDASAAEDPGYTLTKEEYGQLQRILSNTAATPVQVALTNTAVKGTNILLIGMAWICLLWNLRRSWDRWYDEDVYDGKKAGPWPSVVVGCLLIYCTERLLEAAL